MKKRLWLTGLFWITCFSLVYTQVVAEIGLKAGLSLSNQSYQFTPIQANLETDPILGPSLAFSLESFKGDHFSLQTDIAFACRGSSSSIESITVNHLDQNRVIFNPGDPVTSRHRYLSLAPMLRARTGEGRLVPYAIFGPRLDFLLYYSSDSEYPLDQQNQVILGLNFGIGCEFSRDRSSLFVEIQFQPDLSPVTNQEPLLVNNNSLVLTLGIRWKRSTPGQREP